MILCTKVQAALKIEKHHLSLDHDTDVMMTDTDPEQEATSNHNPWPQFIYQYLKRKNSNMMRFLCLLKTLGSPLLKTPLLTSTSVSV